MRQIRSLLLLALLLGFAVTVPAQGSGFGGGTGDLADPYIITSVAHLKHLRAQVAGGESYAGKHFRQKADIDLSSEKWVPIGTADKPFAGNYNGGMHTISGLTLELGSAAVKSLTHVGLFGKVGSVINLHLQDPKASGVSAACVAFGFVAAESDHLESVVVEGAEATITLQPAKNNIAVSVLTAKSTNPSTGLHSAAKLNVTLKVKQLEADVEVKVASLLDGAYSVAGGEATVTLAREGAEKLANNLTLNYCGIEKATNSLLYANLTLKGKEQFEKTFAEGKSLSVTMRALGAASSDSYFDKGVLGGTIEPVASGLEGGKLKSGKPADASNLPESHFIFASDGYPQARVAKYRSSKVKYFDYLDNPVSENPYRVSTGDDLVYAMLEGFPKYLFQDSDIDLPAIKDHLVETFSGEYNGDGHVIRGAKIEYDKGNVGLFGKLEDALISNVTLENIQVSYISSQSVPGGHFVGVLAASSKGKTAIANVQIKNASIVAKMAGDDVFVGGLLGSNEDGLLNVRRVLTDGLKIDVKEAKSFEAGGLIGLTLAHKVNVMGCEVRGLDITLPVVGGPSNVGGLVGKINGALNGPTIIYQCLAEGKIETVEQTLDNAVNAGGMVGILSEDTKIEESAARVSLSVLGKAKAVGGFVGTMSMAKDHFIANSYVFLPDGQSISCAVGNAAGFVGFLQDGGVAGAVSRKIKNCWVSAAVNKTKNTAKAFAVYSNLPNCKQYIETCILDFSRCKLQEGDYKNQWATESNFVDVGSAYSGYDFKDPIVWESYTFGSHKRARLFWETTTAWHPLRGDGSEKTPFEIANADNLRWLMYQDKLFGAQLYFRQVADIDAAPSREWSLGEDKAMIGTKEYAKGFKPLGRTGNAWANSYDGSGHTIRNLWIVRPDEENVGMFGLISGSSDGRIQNLRLENITVMGSEDVGALVGELDDGNFIISNCHAVIDSVVSVNGDLGGLLGYVIDADRIERSSVVPAGDHAKVHVVKAGTVERVGGFVGYLGTSTTVVQESMSLVSIDVPGGVDHVGGFVGENNSMVYNCYARGVITVRGALSPTTGGFVGSHISKMIEQAYAVVPIIDLSDKDKPKHILNCAFAGSVAAKLRTTYFQSPLQGYVVKNASEEGKSKCAALTEERLKNGNVPDGFGAQWKSVKGSYPRLDNAEGQRIHYNQPENGTLVVKEGEAIVLNDAYVLMGVNLTIVLTPNDGYVIDKVTANGTELTVTDNQATYTVASSTVEIVASFKENPVPPAPPVVSVTSVTLSQTEAKVKVDGEITLQVTVNPDNATNKSVTWSSSDENIATVDGGVVKGKAVGTSTIKVVSVDGGKEAVCTVTVEAKDDDKPNAVESQLLACVSVAPNPFATQLTVRNAERVVRYELFSAAGQVVLSGVHGGASDIQLETAHLPSGLYLLRLIASDGERSLRVLRQ